MGAVAKSCLFLIAVALPAAQAAIIDSSMSRDVFQSAFAAGTLFGQNFDSLASGSTVRMVNGVSFSASQGSDVVTSDFLATTPPNGLGSTPSGFFASTESATISFASPITAFAIDINTFAPTSGDYIAALDIGSSVTSRLVYFGGSSIGEFFGFTSDTPFSSVTISPAADEGDHVRYPYTLDTLVFGEAMNVSPATPEASTWALLSCGLGLLLALRSTMQKDPRAGVELDVPARVPVQRDTI